MTNLSGTNLNNATAVGPQGEGKESTSSFPAYPAYKSSGVEWLGEVPEHWTVIALKWLSPVFRGASPRPIDDPIYFDDEGEFGWVRIADVTASPDGYLYETTQKLSALGSSLSVKLEPGELFLSIAGSVGKPCITAVKACIHDGFVYFPWLSIDQRLLYRVFESGLCFGGLGKMGTQLNLNTDTVGGIYIAVPPTAELSRALAFLDHETARIDALIEEQQRLIELLKEKRQAVISHAVTKGLDPTVPMKDSGVEWLGEVPAHWTVAPVKFFFEFLDGQRIPIKAEDRGAMQGDYPYYGASGIIDYVNDFIFEEDLVLVSEDGANLLMRSTPIAFVARGKYWVNNHAHIIRPQDENLTYWAEVIEQQDLTNYVTGSAQPKLTAEALGSIKIAVPPTGSERAAIQAFILKRDADLGALLSEAASGVRLLQERRSALISAAVTGKIDVRGWQPPASTQTPEFEVAEAH